MAMIDNAVQALFKMAHKELLWKNASPGSEFPKQTISLDLSEYDIVFINSMTTLIMGEKGDALYMNSATSHIMFRQLTITETGIIFYSGCLTDTYGSASYTIRNDLCIPRAIYGTKL